MSTQALIPLIAAVANLPLLGILVYNRPWQREHKLAVLFLVPGFLWSATDFFFRGSILAEYDVILLRLGVCFLSWTVVQYHYFLSSFYREPGPRYYFAYWFLAAVVIVTGLGYFATDVSVINNIPVPRYGVALIPIALGMIVLIGRDFFYLLRRFSRLVDPVRRNQMLYLFAGFIIMVVFGFTVGLQVGRHYPLAHLGNLFNIAILTYVVVRHRLLDVRIVVRHGLGWLGLYVVGLAVFVFLLFLANLVLRSKLDLNSLPQTLMAVVVAGVVVYWLRGLIIENVNRVFYRERYDFRQELRNFVRDKLSGVSTLEELGGELLSLLRGSVGCRRAFLLLPEAGSGDLVAEFAEPKEEHILQIRIRKGSPILERLKRENSYLRRESLDILAEFRSVWAAEKKELEACDVELLFPVMSRNSLVAVLALGRKKSGKYLLDDLGLVENTINRVAASVEKEYLQDQLKKREQELSLIGRLTGVVTSSLNIREVYDAFVSELKRVVSVDWAGISLIEGNALRLEVLSAGTASAWQAGESIPLKGTGTQWVAKHKKPYLERDMSRKQMFWTSKRHAEAGLRSIIYLPLVVKGEAIGSLIIGSRSANAYNARQLRLLEQLAAQIAAPVENSRLYAGAEQRARVDELTSLFNRRHFDERLRQEIERHSRYNLGILSLIFLDLDQFKVYNDKKGHLAGDKVLSQIGRLIQKSIRNTDIPFRYGGDEFAIVLPQSETDDAFIVAERIRGNIEREMAGKTMRITGSLGLASWPSDGVTSDELVTAADRALYYSKQTGGNRTCIVSKILPSLAQAAESGTQTEREALSIIYALAATIEARDQYTYGHSRKVSSYAVRLAEAVGLPTEKVAIISTAALLHDIGKIGIPDEVLNKTGRLDAEEWELIRGHPRLSVNIVGHVFSLVSCLPAILHHHERWDGTGYPSGLKGEAIPIEARILAVADAFDAMTSPRPYRPSPLSYKEAVAELKRCSGAQFEPKLVEGFLPIALSTSPDEAMAVLEQDSAKVD